MPVLAGLRTKIAYAHGLATSRRWKVDCQRTAEIQARLLARMLRSHRDTVFGREHDFSRLRDPVSDYRAAVRISDYEGHRSYIDRVVAGEEDVLFDRRQKLLMFNQTSGTTSRPKLIPVTTRWLANYRRASLLWGVFAVLEHPEMFRGRILHITGALQEGSTDLGVPIGSASAVHAATQKRVVRGFYAAPEWTFRINDYQARYYTLARIALADSVSLVATANPSTVLRLVKLIDERSEDLIRDIRDGTLSVGVDLPAHAASIRRLEAQPQRARELEEMRRSAGGRLLPRDYWPDLAFLACWMGGPLAAYIDEIPEWFDPGIPIRDIGLLASEARMTIPIADGTPAGALDIQSHFFEFIPTASAEEDQPRTLLAHEVEVGEEYLLVFTTWSGLYRYDIADVVKVVGFLGGNPMVSFQNKGRHITSLTGEKLSENQVTAAMRNLAARRGGGVSTYVLWPHRRAQGLPGYVLALEELPGARRTAAALAEWAVDLDEELQRQNLEYESKRQSGRLAPLVAVAVPAGCFEAARDAQLARAGTPEQYKHIYLSPERPGYLKALSSNDLESRGRS